MKKLKNVLFVTLILVAILTTAVACTGNEQEAKPDWMFEVGSDKVTTITPGAESWAGTFDVNIKIVGGGNDVLFNGTVNIKSSSQWLSEVVQAAVSDKGLAQEGIDVGFITRIGDYENNSNTGIYWLYTVNGETPQFGVNGYQFRNGDYVLLEYKAFEA